MSSHRSWQLKAGITALATAFMLALCCIPLTTANATEVDDMRAELEAAQERYNACQDELTQLEAKIEENSSKITASENELARLQAELAKQALWEYKNDPASYFLEVITGSKSLPDMVNDIEYLHAMSAQKASLVADARQARTDLYALEDELKAAQLQSEAASEQAKEIVDAIEPELEAYESEMRAYYGYNGGGPMSEVPEKGTVVDYARSRIGCPYVWGAAGPTSFDCSGLTMWAYAQVGISIPHQSEAQYAAADEIVPLSEARPGDILWRSGHVGLCTGYGASSYVHAPDFGCYVREGDPVGWSGFSCALRFNGVN